jgi:hypothetical protein
MYYHQTKYQGPTLSDANVILAPQVCMTAMLVLLMAGGGGINRYGCKDPQWYNVHIKFHKN